MTGSCVPVHNMAVISITIELRRDRTSALATRRSDLRERDGTGVVIHPLSTRDTSSTKHDFASKRLYGPFVSQ